MLRKCKNDTESVDSKELKTKNDGPMLLSKYTVCRSKKSRFKRRRRKRVIEQFKN